MRGHKKQALVIWFALCINLLALPANAQYVVSDPATETSTAATAATNALILAAVGTPGISSPGTLIDTVASGDMSIVTAIQVLANAINSSLGNTANAQNKNAFAVAAATVAAQQASSSIPSPMSTIVPLAQAMQARNAALDAAESTVRSMAYYALAIGSGPSANEKAPASFSAKLCSLMGNGWSFLDASRHGDLANQLHCTNASGGVSTNNRYANADMMINSVTNFLQYPIPKNIANMADNQILFTNVTAAPNTPWKDPVRFVAAWKYCEEKRVQGYTPPVGVNRPPTPNDVSGIWEDHQRGGANSNAFDMCIEEIAYHTACTSGAITQSGGGGGDCFTLQKTMCHALKDDPGGSSGVGIDKIGDPEADNALQNCDTDGLSVAAFDKIMANRCTSYKWIGGIASRSGGNMASTEAQQNQCPEQIQSYEDRMERRKAALAAAVRGSSTSEYNE